MSDDDAQWIDAQCSKCGARFKLEAARVTVTDSELGPVLVATTGEIVSCPLHGSRPSEPFSVVAQWVNVTDSAGAFQA